LDEAIVYVKAWSQIEDEGKIEKFKKLEKNKEIENKIKILSGKNFSKC
jgi:hypothetical protein